MDGTDSIDRYHVELTWIDGRHSDNDRLVVVVQDVETKKTITSVATMKLSQNEEDVSVDAHTVEKHDRVESAEPRTMEADMVTDGKNNFGFGLSGTILMFKESALSKKKSSIVDVDW